MEFDVKNLTNKFYTQIISGLLLVFLSVLQKIFCNMDPLDKDLIINEQCMNLMAEFGFAKMKDVMIKSEFE